MIPPRVCLTTERPLVTLLPYVSKLSTLAWILAVCWSKVLSVMARPTLTELSEQRLLGPLTTTFTEPPNCNIYVYGLWRGQHCSRNTPVDFFLCWPPVTATIPDPPFSGLGYYSPGLICPDGYTSACATTVSSDSASDNASVIQKAASSTDLPEFSFRFPPSTIGERAVGCCTTGFSCAYDPMFHAQTCLATSPLNVWTGICESDNIVSITTTVAFVSMQSGQATTIGTGYTLSAPLFQLNYQLSDLSNVPTTINAASTHVQTSASVQGPIPTVSPTASATLPSATSPPSPLPLGAMIAISTVIALTVIGLIFGLTMFIFRKRRTERWKKSSAINKERPELPSSWSMYPVEAGGHARAELVSSEHRRELPVCGAIGELSAEPWPELDSKPADGPQ